jgi:hypothetical protein
MVATKQSMFNTCENLVKNGGFTFCGDDEPAHLFLLLNTKPRQ